MKEYVKQTLPFQGRLQSSNFKLSNHASYLQSYIQTTKCPLRFQFNLYTKAQVLQNYFKWSMPEASGKCSTLK